MSFTDFCVSWGAKDRGLRRAVAQSVRSFCNDNQNFPQGILQEPNNRQVKLDYLAKQINRWVKVKGRIATDEGETGRRITVALIDNWAELDDATLVKRPSLDAEMLALKILFYFATAHSSHGRLDSSYYDYCVERRLEAEGAIADRRARSITDRARGATKSQELQTDPALFLPEPLLLDENKANWLNPAVENALPFQGRTAELERLTDFAQDPNLFQVWGLSGPSGAGKTRLVVKWMRDFRERKRATGEDWNIGFLDQSAKHLWRQDWQNWTPTRPTFLAIDYIYKAQDIIEELFHRWRPPNDATLPFKLRLLLIDHILPDDLGLLENHAWMKAITSGGADWANKKDLFYSIEPLTLKNDAHSEGQLSKIMQSAAEIFGKQLNDSETADGIVSLQDSVMTWCPLFAALRGYAMATGAESTFGNRRALITHYLDTTNRLPWKERDRALAAQGETVAHFVSTATLLRQVSLGKLIESLQKESFGELNRRDAVDDILARCRWIVSREDPDVLHAFEPDIVGESFVLEFLHHLTTPYDDTQSLIDTLSNAVDHKRDPLQTLEFIGFFQRITRNLENDDQTDPMIIEYWSHFLDFLTCDRFPIDTPIRQAVSIVLTDVVQSLIRCGQNDLAARCLPA